MELGQAKRGRPAEAGYAMAALLVGLSVMAVLMSAAMPVWSQYSKREREEELIWRGQQYARAVGLFQRKFANTFPPTVDVLVEQRFLRKKYKDPITNDDFQLIPVAGGVPPGAIQPPGGGLDAGMASQVQRGATAGQRPVGVVGQAALGIQGVVSKSRDSSLKVYNGRSKYNEWTFVHVATAQRIGPGQDGVQQPGQRGVRSGPPTGPGNRPNVPPGPFGQPPTFPRQTTPGATPNPFAQPPPFGQQPPFGSAPAGRPGPPPQRPPG